MKYLVFFSAFAVMVPVLSITATNIKAVRGWLLTALIVSTALGDMTGINFISTELYRGTDRGFEITLTDLLSIALMASLMLRNFKNIKWFPYNSMFLLAFFSVASVSAAMSAEPLLASFTIFKMLRMYFLYIVVINCLYQGTDFKYVWRGLVIVVLLTILVALHQKYVQGFYRVQGLFDHSNTLPLFLNMIAPMLLVSALIPSVFSRRQTWLSLAAVLGSVATVVMTFSRSGAFLAVSALVVILAVSNWKMSNMRSSLISAVLILFIVSGSVKAADSFINRIKNAPKASGQARDEFNHSAEMMADDRLIGVGPNMFSHTLTNNYRYRQHFIAMANEEEGGVCHHIYKLTAAETGYIGLALFLIVIGRFIWLMFKGFWGAKQIEGLLLFGLMVGSLSLHLGGLLEYAFRVTPVISLFMVINAIGVALSKRISNLRNQSDVSTNHA